MVRVRGGRVKEVRESEDIYSGRENTVTWLGRIKMVRRIQIDGGD